MAERAKCQLAEYDPLLQGMADLGREGDAEMPGNAA